MTDPQSLADCPLHRKTAFVICGVSNSQFSIARFYGGIKYNGETYTYDPTSDELVRNDVLKWLAKQRKQAKQESTPTEEQPRLI